MKERPASAGRSAADAVLRNVKHACYSTLFRTLRRRCLLPSFPRKEEQSQFESLKVIDELREALELIILFAALVRGAPTMTFKDRLTKTESSACDELRGFAKTLHQDEAAVEAAMRSKWSNGPVEGHGNRLKSLKRQMCGRARFDLLRARIRAA